MLFRSQWDFGDGNSLSETLPANTPENIYQDHGDYNVTLTVTNDKGCISTITDEVLVGSKPVAEFSFTPTISCARDELEFIDESTFEDPSVDVENLDEWIWVGTGGFGSSLQDPTHQYNIVDALGFNSVTLTVGYNGCYDTIIKTDIIEILGPIVELVDTIGEVDCQFPYRRTFSMVAGDTTSFVWVITNSLGISDTVSYSNPPVFSHNALGGQILGSDLDTLYYEFPHVSDDYIVNVVAWNNLTEPFDENGDSCEYVGSMVIPIREIDAGFIIAADSICKNTMVEINAANSLTNPDLPKDAVLWQWDFGDGLSTSFSNGNLEPVFGEGLYESPMHMYTDTGKFYVSLTVQDLYGCIGSAEDSVSVFKPDAGFEAAFYSGCSVFTPAFTDTSESVILLEKWIWSAGSTEYEADNNAIPFSYAFTAEGFHVVTLTVVDTLSCSDTATLQIEVIRPSASFSVDKTICASDSVQFSNTSMGYNNNQYQLSSYFWNFGNGYTSVLENPKTMYLDTSFQTIALTVTDELGCVDAVTISDLFVQAYPEIGFEVNSTLFDCYETANAVFEDTTKTDYISYVKWDFGDGSFYEWPTNPDTIDRKFVFGNNYRQRGVFDISASFETTFGCRLDTVFKDYITVRAPYAEYSISDTIVCLNQPVVFTIDSVNDLVRSWEWRFGDGSKVFSEFASSGDDTSHSYTFLPTDGGDFYSVSLLIDNEAGDCPIQDSVRIYVYNVEADFLINGDTLDTLYSCPPFDAQFVDVSSGAKTWQWDFGNGSGSFSQNPANQTYAESNVFEVIMTITGDNGCSDFKSKFLNIYDKPDFIISNDTIACEGDKIQLLALSEDSLSYKWVPSTYLSNDSIYNPYSTPYEPINYVLIGENEYGCLEFDTLSVDVIKVPENFDQTILLDTAIIGDTINLILETADPGYNISWSPTQNLMCDNCFENKYVATKGGTYDYLIELQDTLGLCPAIGKDVEIVVRELCAADVADALTPDGDGQNDMIYLRGWGISEVVIFDIYNRWGERVYRNPGDLYHGWDGSFNGKPQPMDTYLLLAQVKFYCSEEVFEIKKQVTLYR